MIVPLDAIGDGDLAAVGGKALHLAEAMRSGLPVPPGFVIPAAAYRAHVGSQVLAPRLRTALETLEQCPPGERGGILAGLRAAIIAAPLSEELRAEIGERHRALAGGGASPAAVTVRSSATAEDLADRSFAGQYDTFLDVAGLEGCLRAVKGCWASLWTDRAFEYREKSKLSHLGVEMAVLVQAMVPAEVSCVVFTADPVTGRRDRVVIESIAGRGDALVSGRTAPDRLVLARPGLEVLRREAGSRPSLDDAQAVVLARLALEAEEALGVPLDLEWSFFSGKPCLLQARPITTLSRGRRPEDRQAWTNANAGEVLPDVVTPLTWSVVSRVAQALLERCFALIGVDIGNHPLLGRIAGRAYFSLNTILAAARIIPGVREEEITKMFGGHQDDAAPGIADEDIPDLGTSRLSFALRIPAIAWRFLTLSPSKGNAVIEGMRRKADRESEIRPGELSVSDLVARIRAIVDDLVGDGEVYQTIGISQIHGSAFYGACAKLFGEDGNGIASRALMALGTNTIVEAGPALWRLARRARESPDVATAVMEAGSFAALRGRLSGTGAGDGFLGAWEAFMEDHGHHARGELELMNPRWSEEPDAILEQLRGFIGASGEDDFLERYERLSGERTRAIAAARRRLRNPLKRMLFDFLLRKAQRSVHLRECLKNELVRRLAAGRVLILETGGRLAESGGLARHDDIFFLGLEEIEDAVRGGVDRSALGALIEGRRAEHERNRGIRPPPVVVGRFDPAQALTRKEEETSETLRGVAVNPGVVTGPARVILQSGEDRVRPGEVLVVPFTDPGWTPYFLNAAAIVMDMGGLLSHGSIVAREFGIPAVANVGPATVVIKTGQRVQVDGDRGIVRILNTDASD